MKADQERLSSLIEADAPALGVVLRLVWFDTLGSMRSAHHLREVPPAIQDLTRFLRWLTRRLRTACVGVLHHTNASGENRGPMSVLTGDAETVLRCDSIGDQVYVTHEKQRYSVSGDTFLFDAISVDLAADGTAGASPSLCCVVAGETRPPRRWTQAVTATKSGTLLGL